MLIIKNDRSNSFDRNWFATLLNSPGISALVIDEDKQRIKELEDELYRLKTQNEAGRRLEAARQHEEKAAQEAMLRASNESERVAAYRQALQTDVRISEMKILNMSKPLALTNLYVRLQLHANSSLSYNLDPQLITTENKRDPNEHFKALHRYRASRSKTAFEPIEAIQQYPRSIILGDPGAGKTTMLKFLVLQAAKGELADLPNIPLHIELNQFARCGHSDLIKWAAEEWEERYHFSKAEALIFLQKHLAKGKILVLLDALDETVIGVTPDEAEESYNRVSEAIEKFVTAYPDKSVILNGLAILPAKPLRLRANRAKVKGVFKLTQLWLS